MNLKKLFSRSLALIRQNLRSLAMFEILYIILVTVAVTPLALTGFRGIMQMAGYRYLTIETVPRFLMNPLVIITLLLMALVVGVIEAWHLCTVVCILDRSEQGKKVNVWPAIKYSVRNSGWALHASSLLLALYLLFIMPFLGFGTGVISSLALPEFIQDSISKNALYTGLLITVYLVLSVFMLRWIYSVHYMMLDGQSFARAARSSAKLFGKHWLRDVLLTVLVRVAMIAICGVIVIAGVAILALLGRIGFVATDVILSGVGVVLGIGVLLAMLFAVPSLYAMISVLFYAEREETGEPVRHVQCEEAGKPSGVRRVVRAVACVAVIGLVTAGVTTVLRAYRHGDLNLNLESLRTMEISAHRGASAFYPENTMAAFRGAVEQNADWIELDVQQSKDGVVFVMHDTSFGRTTGVNKGCWELTWDEIRQLDAGSFFSKEYAGEPIPTLQEVIDYAKEVGIRLNIELKPTGHETDFEKQVVDIINASEFAGSCVVTSQVYDVVKNVKAYDPSITTVYVMAVALGDIEALDCADSFSIEATFINENLVSRMHSLGKQVFAWTIDSEESIEAMIELDVDNIITNDVPTARQCVIKNRNGGIVTEFMEMLLGKQAIESEPTTESEPA